MGHKHDAGQPQSKQGGVMEPDVCGSPAGGAEQHHVLHLGNCVSVGVW